MTEMTQGNPEGSSSSATSYDRERDRDEPEERGAKSPFDRSGRSYRIAWCPKKFASIASMELWSVGDTKHLDMDNQWRWHSVACILAENYSVFDAHLDNIFQGFKSTMWNCKGHCPIHGYKHEHNRWCLINTPGFPHTTKVKCFHSGVEYLISKMPF